MAGSWRQKNLRSRWRIRQYKMRRENVGGGFRAISQWIAVILYGFQTIGTPRGIPKACKLYTALSEPMKDNPNKHNFFVI